MPNTQIVEHELKHEVRYNFFDFTENEDFDLGIARAEGIPISFVNNKYAKCNKGGCPAIFRKVWINHEEETPKIGYIRIDFQGNDISKRIVDEKGKEINA